MITAAQLIAQARTYGARSGRFAVPWVHQGRSRRGVDCAGLIVCALQDLGAQPFDVAGYSSAPHGGKLLQYLLDAGCVHTDLCSGALGVFRFARQPQHLALIVPYAAGGFGLLHALSSVGKVAEHRLDADWSQKMVAVFALPGVTY